MRRYTARMATIERGTPDAGNHALIDLLSQAFKSAGFTQRGVQQSAIAAATLGGSATRLQTLVRLFVLHEAVSEAAARKALSPATLFQAQAAGLIHTQGSTVYAAVELSPVGDLLLAVDWPPDDPAESALDQVMSPARSSRLLCALTSQRPAELALDLGCGCGYAALHLARQAERVIATDLNERALSFTAFNARLNGVTNVECRQGDWFEPVADLTFDVIACNPPFVIAPEQTLLYRDDATGRGGLSRKIVQMAPTFLRPGGLAHVLIGWVHEPNEHWSTPLSDWVAGSGCDAWFFRQGSYEPPRYAALWNGALAGHHEKYARAMEHWTRFFGDQGIHRLADGAVVLRRREGGHPHSWFDNLPSEELGADAADDLAARIRAQDELEPLDDSALLQRRFELVREQRLEQVLRHNGQGFEVVQATLILEKGLRSTFSVNSLYVRLLSSMDGQRTLAEVIERATSHLSSDTAARFGEAALPAIRQGVAHGFLHLAG